MMTTTQEKLTDRVWLLAFGAVHWSACMGEKDLSDIHAILVEEFARAKATGESLKELRAYLAEHGVRVPEHVATSERTEAHVNSPHPYVRRANNQVLPETEALIRELLSQGQTKSAISRVLRVNRRVVIRVAGDMVEMKHRRVHSRGPQRVG